MPRSEGTGRPRRPSNRFIRPLAGVRVLQALDRIELERFQNPLVVGVVVVGQPEGQLEPAGADQLAQRLEARLHLAPLPAADLRLRTPDSAAELGLREPGAQAGFAQQICTDHQYKYVIGAACGNESPTR